VDWTGRLVVAEILKVVAEILKVVAEILKVVAEILKVEDNALLSWWDMTVECVTVRRSSLRS